MNSISESEIRLFPLLCTLLALSAITACSQPSPQDSTAGEAETSLATPEEVIEEVLAEVSS